MENMKNLVNMTSEELSSYLTKELVGKEPDHFIVDFEVQKLISAILPQELADHTSARLEDGRSSEIYIRYKGCYLFTVTIKKIVDKERSSDYPYRRKYTISSIMVSGHDSLEGAYKEAFEELERKEAFEKNREERAYQVLKNIHEAFPSMKSYEIYALIDWMSDHSYHLEERYAEGLRAN